MMQHQDRLLGVEADKADRTWPTIKRLGQQFKPYWFVMIVVFGLVVLNAYLQVLVPDMTGQVVDCYLTPYATGQRTGITDASGLMEVAGDAAFGETAAADNCWYTTADPTATAEETISGMAKLIATIALIYVGSALATGTSFYLMRWAGFYVLRDLREKVFGYIHGLSLGFFSRHEIGDIMSRFTNDMDTLQQAIGFALLNVVQGVLLLGWIVYTMFSKNVPFSIISLITLPIMFIATRWFSGQARKAFRKARQEIGSVNSNLQESISSVREVQAFSREDENIAQFRDDNAANRDANVKAQAYTSALAPTLEALSYVSLAIVASVGGILLLNDMNLMGTTVSMGLIITFILYTQQFNRPVQQISVLWTNIQSAIAGAERIFGLLDEDVDIADKPDAITMPHIEGHVRLDGVWAEYNLGEPVLKGIDIEATPGKTIAIVGPTGAGKTTIINLLPRFWDVTQGAITIDGHDVRDVTAHSLRKQIGLVLQDTFLFSDTVMDNIRYGRPDATDEEVIEAAKLARADGFINKLENGYDTVLGERGAGLSQGQRQLLAIARVTLTDPRILILDEATSSVDTRTERLIQTALDTMLQGRTSFVIAHRLSTIRNADEVLVLEAGHIIERGTHDSLLEAGGFYYDLYMSQFRRQAEES